MYRIDFIEDRVSGHPRLSSRYGHVCRQHFERRCLAWIRGWDEFCFDVTPHRYTHTHTRTHTHTEPMYVNRQQRERAHAVIPAPLTPRSPKHSPRDTAIVSLIHTAQMESERCRKQCESACLPPWLSLCLSESVQNTNPLTALVVLPLFLYT